MVGFLVSTGASLLMNGVCCVYQMNEEKDLREAMRKDIREEWRVQRQREFEVRKRYKKRSQELRFEALEKRYRVLETNNTNKRIDGTTYTAKKHASLHESDEDSLSLTYSMDSFPSLLDEDLDEDDLAAEENPQQG
jgi:hypothetical protein